MTRYWTPTSHEAHAPLRRAVPPPVIAPGHTFASVTDKISAIVLTRKTSLGWWFGFGIAFALVNVLMISIAYLLFVGTGIWGINIPVGWGFAIINFVWWIGIGHAGTLISAILLLFKQTWRTSINRFAEAMTLFAVACAAIFPMLHTGRPWLAIYWLFPYPNTMDVWPQFRSPLIWDVFAVSTYATVSLLFWFVGLIPDLATLRDRSESKVGRVIYGALAMGWRGSAHHWHRYETAYLLLAGLATPLVVSVHTIVSFDFAVSVIPGMARDGLPALFRRGRHLFGIRDGADARDSDPHDLRAAGLHHRAPSEQHGEDPARDRAHRRLRLHDRSVHGVVQREHVRDLHDAKPDERAVRAVLLGAHLLQRPHAAAALDQEDPHERGAALHHLADRERRHVARALRHRRHVAASRLPAVVVGPLFADGVGLGTLRRHDRLVPVAAVPVPALPADDFDLRDADARAGCDADKPDYGSRLDDGRSASADGSRDETLRPPERFTA